MYNNDNTESRRRFIINFVYFAIIIGIAIFIARYAVGVLVPFVVALVVASIIRPIIKAMKERWRLKNNAAAIIAVLFFFLIIVAVALVVVTAIVKALVDMISGLPEFYSEMIEPALISAVEAVSAFLKDFEVLGSTFDENAVYDFIASLGATISSASVTFISFAGAKAASLPKLMLNMVITVIATVFLSVDWDGIKKFIYYQFSEETQMLFDNISVHLKKILKQYVTSYATIMFITFMEIFAGLLILKVNNATLIAGIIAVFDILPVVGSGIIILPWAIISLLSGAVGRGVGLFVLWAAVSVIRNVIEPKIIGDNVGLHPLVALIAMISGTYIFGPLGLLGFPVSLALIQSLNDAGVIHVYKTVPKAPVPVTEHEEGLSMGDLLKLFVVWLGKTIKFLKEKIAALIKWARNDNE